MDNQPPIPKQFAWLSPSTWTEKARWWAVMLLLFVVYPLSYGPAWGLAMRGWIPVPALYLYFPITALCYISGTFGQLVMWYTTLFDP